jgi:hypothetical protein
VVYLTPNKLVLSMFVGFERMLPGFDQHLAAKCPVIPLLFGAEHHQSLAIALTNVG